MYKVKIDGRELDIPDEELVRGYQLRQVSQRRMEEAASSRKQVAALLNNLKTNRGAAIAELLNHPEVGLNFEEIATEHLAQKFQRQAMDPRERELLEAREQLAAYKQQEESRAQAEQKAQNDRFVAEYRKEIQADIDKHVKSAGLPETPRIKNQVVSYLRKAVEAGYTDLTAKDVMPLVKRDFEADVRALVSGRDGPSIAALLGDEVVGTLRQHSVQTFKGAPAETKVVTSDTVRESKASQKKRPKTYEQLMDEMQRKAR